MESDERKEIALPPSITGKRIEPPAEGELVTIGDEEGFMVQFTRDLGAALTTFGGDSEEDNLRRINCLGPAQQRLSKMVPNPPESMTLEVVGFVLHPVKRTNQESGEITLGPRLVLVTAEGKTVVSSSNAVASMIAHAMRAFKDRPWNPPVRLECFMLKSGTTGHDYVACRLLPRKQETNAKKK